ncbi:MAG TPA: hypothetical protein VH234_01680 [Candidatus Saccharimonadales bacterium]|nr:hypothetical protein [Candidatus Saccharimonadales bacterium]
MEFDTPTAKVDKDREKDTDDDDTSTKKKRAGRASLRLVESRKDKDKEPEKDPIKLFKTPPAEIKTASKEEVPDEEEVSASEKPLAVKALAAEEARAIPENSEVPDVVAKNMLEEAEATGDLDAAAEHAVAAIGATIEELQSEEQKIEAEALAPAAEVDEAEPETEEAETGEPTEEVMFDRAAEQPPDEPVEDEAAAAMTGAGTAGGGAIPPPAPPGGSGAGIPPFGRGGPGFPPGGPGGPAPIPTLSGNLYHTPITPNSPAVERYDQGNPAVTALVGGIIGYFIGRRRGRIKTEKRLLPIQKKLEKQVEDLHWEVKRKELAVRRLAVEKVRQNGPLVIERLVARPTAKTERQTERKVERKPAPEASQLHGAKTHEHLGHMLVTAEAAGSRRQKQPENVLAKKIETNRNEQIPEHLRNRHIETLNRAELLTLSEKIIVDGTSLRQIYETHLIGERGLRRLVGEYLRGGEVKKVLRQEIVEHEIDFERDPAMRDLPAQATPARASTAPATKSTLDKLVEQASAGLGNQEALAYYKARAAYEAQEQEEQQSQRRLVDIGLATTITALIIVIAVLYLSHH